MRTQDVTVNFDLTLQRFNGGDQTDLRVFYKLCVYGDCTLTEDEAKGIGVVESAILNKSVNDYTESSLAEIAEKVTYKG